MDRSRAEEPGPLGLFLLGQIVGFVGIVIAGVADGPYTMLQVLAHPAIKTAAGSLD